MPTPQYGDLATDINSFMTSEAIKPYLANLPNYADMVGQRTQNIGSQLKGQLPQDVINQISQQAAERGVGSGSPGSANSNSAYLRALGLNSMQLQQQGSQNLSSAIADTPVPQLFNPASLIVPQINSNLALQQARLGQQVGARAGMSGNQGPQYASVIGMPNVGFGPDQAQGAGPMSVSGPSWGNPAPANNPNLYNDWWSSYGGAPQSPVDTGWEDTAFGNQGNGWQDTSWEDAAFGNYFE